MISIGFILSDINDVMMSMKNWFELTVFGITVELLINKK